MQGNNEVIELLNAQLTTELTSINQYFLHAKMQEHWGFTKLAQWTRSESFDEMRHAETVTNRILLLEGLPNYQRILPINVGENVPEQLRSDLALEYDGLQRLRDSVITCRAHGDAVSARLFEEILESEEDHIDKLETELALLATLGEQLYLAQLRGGPGEGE
jgi:bacterioferritin